ncbi:hypothetical protein CXG81DRAFT_26593 [Caulochytrium protostelioides]|uniref:Uncharacterized protein n=1 Tax=Caulochytrium protostelioides TaxID=1555241 RepID=A0A4P9X6C7_9FUNG|nr:hypothetical protein CXG81DRAFT_26593 [Caulochytrium protostelioides]|eukprot:RKP00725.1 hypothetical protein CXG81DRAFT_26593 [Caulochytrium protostelioides]
MAPTLPGTAVRPATAGPSPAKAVPTTSGRAVSATTRPADIVVRSSRNASHLPLPSLTSSGPVVADAGVRARHNGVSGFGVPSARFVDHGRPGRMGRRAEAQDRRLPVVREHPSDGALADDVGSDMGSPRRLLAGPAPCGNLPGHDTALLPLPLPPPPPPPPVATIAASLSRAMQVLPMPAAATGYHGSRVDTDDNADAHGASAHVRSRHEAFCRASTGGSRAAATAPRSAASSGDPLFTVARAA